MYPNPNQSVPTQPSLYPQVPNYQPSAPPMDTPIPPTSNNNQQQQPPPHFTSPPPPSYPAPSAPPAVAPQPGMNPIPNQSPIPPYAQQPQQQQPHQYRPVEVLNFVVDEHFAANKFKEWAASLWFAPTAFSKQADVNNIRRAYIPFYVVSAQIIDTYKAEISYKQHHATPPVPNDKNAPPHPPQHWHPQFGSTRNVISNVWFSADANEKFRGLTDHFHTYVGQTYSSDWSILQQQYAISPCAGWGDFLAKVVKPDFEEREKKFCRQLLEKANPTHESIRNLHVDVQFEDIQTRIVYVPFFVGEYIYNDVKNEFLVNAVSGDAQGQRPGYGLGSIGNAANSVKNFLGTLTGTNDAELGILSGEKLNEKDGKFFDPNLYYLVFPRSNSYLITESIGIVTLTNKSTSFACELQSQKRRGVVKGPTYVLQPGETKSFDYKGHWAIKVNFGSISDISIDAKTSGGGSAGDALGMKTL